MSPLLAYVLGIATVVIPLAALMFMSWIDHLHIQARGADDRFLSELSVPPRVDAKMRGLLARLEHTDRDEIIWKQVTQ